jgi:hypothetical protein
MVFKSFGLPAANHSLHFLRAYHLVDILKRTSQEDVEFTLLNSFEFSKSDKKKGIFSYHEAVPAKEELQVPAAEIPAEVEEFLAGEEIPLAEIPEALEEELEIELAAAGIGEKPKPEAAPAAKKEKPYKKKKAKAEGEKAPRAKKSERRVIEERIEEEESEMEAFYAEKAPGEEEIEGAAAETPAAVSAEVQAEAPPEAAPEAVTEESKKKEAPAEAAPGSMFGNLFAEKLKSALTKKRKEDTQKKE